MKKAFAFAMIVLIMTSLLAGCGNMNQVQSGTELTSKGDSQAPVEEEERYDISSVETDVETEGVL